MNIAMVSEHASPLASLGGVDAGGQNVHVTALATAMAALGHSVTVYTRRDDPCLPERVAMDSGILVHHINAGPATAIAKDAIYPHVPEFSQELRQAWQFDRPDVVHSHFWMSGIAAIAAAGTFGLPTVHTYHALGIEKLRHQGTADTSPAIRIFEEAQIAREADCIVATSRAEIEELQNMGAPPRAIRVIPCGVDVDQFSPDGICEIKNPDVLRIVTISRLVPRKGIDTVIESLASVPSAELIVAGGGEAGRFADDPETRRLLELASGCGVAERVFLRGPVERPRVVELLRSADVVVCTPWYEPFGIVALEAMACAVPVVASSVGGLRDTVIDGVTGFHVSPRSPSELAIALRRLQSDERLRRAFGRVARERVTSDYTWAKVALETLDAYRLVIDGEASQRFAMAR
jgi:glycosyltransferase involved in cell wall biosynthesis